MRPQSTSCRLRGSELVQRMRLDERVAIEFATHLTWIDGVRPAGTPPPSAGNGVRTGPPAAAGSVGDGSWQNGARELAGRLARPFTSLGGGDWASGAGGKINVGA